MVNKYTIKVVNKSGAHQHYALFNKAPAVTGKVQGQIWSNVFATANTPSTQSGKFSIYNQYYAVVGSAQGNPGQGVQVDVAGDRDVTLGSTASNGAAVPGTTLSLLVEDGAPQFSNAPLPDGSFPNAFEIRTGNDFTVAEAKKNHYMIGLGGSKSGGSDGPTATFVPEPGNSYQIQPVNIFYITAGDYQKGSLIDVQKINTSVVTIDFTQQDSDDIVIVHDDHGKLNIQIN